MRQRLPDGWQMSLTRTDRVVALDSPPAPHSLSIQVCPSGQGKVVRVRPICPVTFIIIISRPMPSAFVRRRKWPPGVPATIIFCIRRIQVVAQFVWVTAGHFLVLPSAAAAAAEPEPLLLLVVNFTAPRPYESADRERAARWSPKSTKNNRSRRLLGVVVVGVAVE